MRRRFLLVILIFLIFLSAFSFSYSPPTRTSGAAYGEWTKDLTAAINLAKTNNTYFIIFYGSSVCSFCSTALRNVFDTETFYSWSRTNKIPLVYADRLITTSQPGVTIKKKYFNGDATGYPTIIFVNSVTDTPIKFILFRALSYKNFDDFLRIAPAVTAGTGGSTGSDGTTPPAQNCTTEICNGIDDDCDGQIDEGLTRNYYLDADGDGFGAGNAITACIKPAGNYVLTNNDCDNTNPNIKPGTFDICDGLDNDCDFVADEGFECVKNSAHCTLNCSYETKRTSSCQGAIPPYALSNKTDNKYSEKWNGSNWVEIENKNYFYSPTLKDCTYSCIEGYYNLGTECLPYTCSIGSANLGHSVPCENDSVGLRSSITNMIVSSCTSERKCEYVCESNYYLGIVNGARACLPNLYQCIGAVDGNSVVYEGDDFGFDVDIQVTLTDVNSDAKCEYRCKKNFILNSTRDKCIPNPFVCEGVNLIDSNAILYIDDNSDLLSNTLSKLVGSNSSNKCEYHCKDGYQKGSGVDENKCLISTFACTGSIDSNAIMYPDENIGLDGSYPKKLVDFNSSAKCEWYCKEGYVRGNGYNNNVCLLSSIRTCDGNIDPNAELYVGDDESISAFDNRTNILVEENSSLKCEWYCKRGYYLSSSENGYFCKKEEEQKFFCTGLIDANSVLFNNDDKGLDSDLNRVLVDVNTSRKCEYYCKSGYYLGSVSGVGVCLPSNYYCKGNVINGAVIYIGDDSGLTSDLNSVLVENNTSRKCEYHCANHYTKVGESCVLSVISNAVCGNAQKSYTPKESFFSSYSLCDVGVVLESNLVLGSNVGSIVEWTCVSDVNVSCSATRVSDKYVPVIEDSAPLNSILTLTSQMLEDGNIEVKIKCLKTTVVDLNIVDYLSKESYSSLQNKIDCTTVESTHTISLESAPSVERSLIINASIGESDSDCTDCKLDYFMDYAPVQSNTEDNSIWFIILGIMVVCVIGVGAFLIIKKK